MSDSTKPTKRRLWIPALIVIANIGLHFWIHQSEHMMGGALRFLGTLISLLLIWFWFTFLSGIRGVYRLLSLLAGLALIVFLASSLRNEGSADGSGIPRFVWRWSPSLDEQSRSALSELPGPSQSDDSVDSNRPLKFRGVDSLQFYGPQGNGVIAGLTIDRSALAQPLDVLWKQPIGLGWSSFAVKGRIAVTQEQRGDEEWVSAYDLENGSLLWHYAKPRRFSESMGGDGPRATPIIHNDTVYALGATGILDALQLATGAHQWSHNALQDQSNLVWGKSASPLFLEDEELIVVTGGKQGGPTIQAVSAEYGNLVWSSGTDAASYASPIQANIHGERQLVSVNENTVVGIEPATGNQLWSFDWPVGMMQPSAKAGQPSVINDTQVFISASYGVGSMLFDVVKNEDGSFETKLNWRSRNRMKTKFSTACVRGNYAYGLDEGFLACIDLSTGKRMWKDGRYKFGQNLLVDDIVIIQAEDGDVAFVEANPEEYVELARLPGIEGKTWNIPVLAGEYLLIRNDREAACLRLPLVAPTP